MTSADTKVYNAACHCRAVQFTVRLSEGFRSIRRCTCSLCRMRGAVAVSADLDGICFVSGEEHLSLYRFNTGAAKHYFCSICGIYTHHQRRSNPHEFGINVACLEGVSPFDFEDVDVYDGVNHPTDANSGNATSGAISFGETNSGDAKCGPRVDGVLSYRKHKPS